MGPEEVQFQSNADEYPKFTEDAQGLVDQGYKNDVQARASEGEPVGELTWDKDPRPELAAQKAAAEAQMEQTQPDAHLEAAVADGIGSETDAAWTEADTAMVPPKPAETTVQAPEWAAPQYPNLENAPTTGEVSLDSAPASNEQEAQTAPYNSVSLETEASSEAAQKEDDLEMKWDIPHDQAA